MNSMVYPFLTALIFLLNTSFSDGGHTYVFDFDVSDQSAVLIQGQTNVNEFHCNYHGTFHQVNTRVKGRSEGLSIFLEGARFHLLVQEFECENSIMTREFHHTLKAEEHPKIHMEIKKMTFEDEESFNASNTKMQTVLKVTAAGKSKSYLVDTERKLYGNEVHFKGNFNLKIDDFGIVPPSRAFGLVKVNSTLQIAYSLIFKSGKVNKQLSNKL